MADTPLGHNIPADRAIVPMLWKSRCGILSSMTESQGPSDDVLWQSSNPRFGVVRAVMVDEGFAAALDDLNGDHREVSLELHRRSPAGWLPIGSIDDVGLPAVGEDGDEGWILGCAYAFGRVGPNVEVTVYLHGQTRTVRSNDAGWWFSGREAWD